MNRILLTPLAFDHRANAPACTHFLTAYARNVFQVDWVYSLAEYYDPPEEIPINHVGPVSPLFAGWTDVPELPTTAVFGLGFEPGKVLGAAEYLESGNVFAFIPDGPDERFKASVLKSNRALLEELSSEHVVSYRVANPFDTFVWIEGMCAGLIRRSRLILVPFGPRIFALNCMLAALEHSPRVMVLRVSGFGSQDHDVKAAGPLYAIRSIFRRTEMSN